MPSKNKFSSVWTEIDLKALQGNLSAIRRTLSNPKTEIMAIVKADAYGHGMRAAAKALSASGVSFFGVANIQEASELRKILPRAKILVLGCAHPSQIAEFISKKIIPTISCLEDAKKFKGPVHVKIDTGMGRLGMDWKKAGEFFIGLKKLSYLKIEGIYTHFSSADEESAEPTRIQLERFEKILELARMVGLRPKYIHASNSMGCLQFSEAHFNLVRPGILLYGLKPSPRAKLPQGIRPVLSWKTRIAFLKPMMPGDTVSYGRTHQVRKKTVIAALPVGYSHGYRITLSNKSHVLIRGRRCPVVGRVTMDQILVDVGRLGKVSRWEEVVLIGRQKNESMSAEEMAGKAGTIPYEITCGIHPRVPRGII